MGLLSVMKNNAFDINKIKITITLTYQKNDGTIRTGYCGIWYKDSSFVLTQVQLTTNTGNIKTGRMTLWGIAHA